MSPASKAAGSIFTFSGGYNPPLNAHKIASQFCSLLKLHLKTIHTIKAGILMKKLLYVIPCLKGGGIEKLLFEWIKRIDLSVYQVTVAVLGAADDAQLDQLENMNVVVLVLNSRYREIIRRVRFFKELFKKNNYNIVHVNTMVSFDVLPLIIAKHYGIGIRIFNCHAIFQYDTVVKKIINLICRKQIVSASTHILACSNEAGKSIFGKIENKKISYKVLKNGIDIDLFKFNADARECYRKKFNIENNTVYGHIGRFNPVKNQEFLINLMPEILKRDKSAKLILIGNGQTKEKCRKLTLELGLDNYVVFLDNRDDVNKLYHAMDIFLLPSIYEGFGLVLLEAQTSGLPCLCSDAIVDEAAITAAFERLPLSESKENWADCAEKLLNEKIDRENAWCSTEQAGYDIMSMVERLLCIYGGTDGTD